MDQPDENSAQNSQIFTNQSQGKFSAEELKQKISHLKSKVEDNLGMSAAEIKKEVQERDFLMESDSKLLPVLEEAELAIERFETAMQDRFEIDKNNLKDFEDLKSLVSSLRKKNDQAVQQYEDLVQEKKNSEERLRADHEQKIQAFAQQVTEKLGKSVDNFEQSLEDLEKRRAQLIKQQGEEQAAMDAVTKNITGIIASSIAKLDPVKSKKTREALEGYKTAGNFSQYISQLEQYKKSLGFFSFGEKSAVSAIISHTALAKDADGKTANYNKTTAALEELEVQITDLAAQYKASIVGAVQAE